MTAVSLVSGTGSVPYLKVGGEGDTLFFAHANGYPPLAYRSLLGPLTQSHTVIAGLHRPLWPKPDSPNSLRSWRVFSADVESLLAPREQAVFGMGHSMGTAALISAAARQPKLFKGLILIEPVLVPASYCWSLRLFKPLVRRTLPLVRRTLARQQEWQSRQQAFDHFRPKAVFKRIGDDALWDYVNYGLIEREDGQFELAFSREWEAACYLNVQNIWPLLDKLEIPILAIRGERSNVLSQRSWQRWRAKSPQHRYEEIAGTGHLVPFERPQDILELVSAWLGEHN
ncbi:MAG TPA: alpha/beta hydrolase [Gammaproteobacteria bacterium]|nr:alpha/beta hydrolase [Gammaproteobacteria bacterium]|tara:strand:- start:1160 stop:2014 length:855 start_codon:yes stop_codon:yes gene_type:complete